MSEIIITSNSMPAQAAAAPSADLADKGTEQTKAVAAEQTQQAEIPNESATLENNDQAEENVDNTEESDDQVDEGQQVQKKKSGNGFKKRLGRVQAERDYWRDIALQAQAGKEQKEPEQKQVPQPKVEATGKPTPDQFDQYVDYIEALTEWKVEQKELARQEQAQKAAQQTEAQQAVQKFEQKVEEFKKSAPDFQDVVSELDDYVANPALYDAVLTSEYGAQLVYDLAKNRKELDRINALNPAGIFREIGKLEAKFANSSQQQQTKPLNKTTNAPKPISPIGSGSGSGGEKSLSDPSLTQAEYERLRRKQKGA